MELLKVTMPALASLLSTYMDLPVVDMTNLKGSYRLDLDMSMQDLNALARTLNLPEPDGGRNLGASDPSGRGLSKAIEQLGLRLEKRQAPVDTIVVDHLERTPTGN